MCIFEQTHDQYFFNQGIKCPDEIGNLMRAKTNISGNAIQTSIGTLVGKAKAFTEDILYWYHNGKADTGMKQARNKVFLTAVEH